MRPLCVSRPIKNKSFDRARQRTTAGTPLETHEGTIADETCLCSEDAAALPDPSFCKKIQAGRMKPSVAGRILPSDRPAPDRALDGSLDNQVKDTRSAQLALLSALLGIVSTGTKIAQVIATDCQHQ